MKRYFPVQFFAILLFYYSCASNHQTSFATYASAITATNNGVVWTPTLSDTLKNDTLTLHARNKRDLLRLEFPISGSSYNLTESDGQYFYYDNSGTTITKTFKLDPGYPNTVTALVNNTVNSTNKYYTGQFKARFILDTAVKTNDTIGVNSITLTNGRFTATYK